MSKNFIETSCAEEGDFSNEKLARLPVCCQREFLVSQKLCNKNKISYIGRVQFLRGVREWPASWPLDDGAIYRIRLGSSNNFRSVAGKKLEGNFENCSDFCCPSDAKAA